MPEEATILLFVTPPLVYLCVTEWRHNRLPNKIIIGMLACSLVWRLGFGGWKSFADGLLACLLAGAPMFILFLMRGLGAGDVKMTAAVVCILGLKRLYLFTICFCLATLLLGLAHFLFRKTGRQYLKYYIKCCIPLKCNEENDKRKLPSRRRRDAWLPLGLAIAGGTWATLLLELFHIEGFLAL